MRTLITGASRGIGLAVANALACEGHDLLMLGRDDKLLNKAAGKICDEYGVNVDTLAIDLTDEGAAKEVAKFVGKDKLNHLVLNAGTYRDGKISEMSYDVFEEQMAVNVKAVWELVQALLPKIEKKGSRRIVLTGSTSAFEATSTPSYSVTKWALRGYVANLREELRSKKIGVTHLAPGGVFTDMWRDYPGTSKFSKEDRYYEKHLMEPADVAIMVRAALALSEQANVDEVIVRPMSGDLH